MHFIQHLGHHRVMAACPSRVETCSHSSSRKALQQMHCSSSWQSGEAAWRSTGASKRANGGPCYRGCPPQRSLSCEGCLQLARAPCPQVCVPVKKSEGLGLERAATQACGPQFESPEPAQSQRQWLVSAPRAPTARWVGERGSWRLPGQPAQCI